MSMNIYITGKREIFVPSIQKNDEQTVYFKDVVQTPTRVTYAIVANENPIQSYIEHILSYAKDEEEFIYEPDDIFGEKEPIDTEIINWGKEHVQELKEWLQWCETNGYKVEVGVW